MIWVELLSRQREVLVRHRIDQDSATIGRGYQCDLLIDDPHLAACHLRVTVDEHGRFVAEDLGSLNGFYVGQQRASSQRVVLEPDQTLRIGSTLLRFRGADHGVAGETPIPPANGGWRVPALLIAATLGIALVEIWLTSSGEPKLSEFLSPLTLVLLLGAAWAGAWAIAARIFSRTAGYARHLEIAFGGLLVFAVANWVLSLLAYALSTPGLNAHGYLPLWLILAGACLLHLRSIGPSHTAWKAGVVTAAAVAGIGFSLLLRQEQRDTFGPSVVLGELYPPYLRAVPATHPEQFFADSQALKAELDLARVEEEAIDSPQAELMRLD